MPIYTFPPGAAGGGGGGVSVDTRAATLVVNPTGQNADFMDIPSAVAALALLSPVNGGKIFLREGLYTLPAVLPNIPIVFEGAAVGSAFSPAVGTIIDLGGIPIDMFTILVGGTPGQKYLFKRINFVGAGVAGQNIVEDDNGSDIEFEECTFQGIDKPVRTTGAFGTTLVYTRCESFSIKQIIDATVDFGSIVKIYQSLLFVDGPVAVNGHTAMIVESSFINTFALVNPTMQLGFGSSFVNSRLLMDMTIDAGIFSCRFAAFSMLGLLTINGSENNIGSGSSIESVPAGIILGGNRNTVDGVHFSGVAAPITETTGDFNLVDAVNGFAGSTFPVGANSVLGTVIP